jgi:hypothetical protein
LIFDGINQFDEVITLPPVAQRDLFFAFNSVIYDNPILFYTRAFSSSNLPLSRQATIRPVYKYDQDFTDRSADVISDYLKLFDSVKNESDIEKELFVHDYCLDNFTYDHQFNEHAFSVLGPVVFNTGVCEGISKFVKIALNYLGVDCIVVAGKALNPAGGRRKTERHMWNIVYINGTAYHLDVTFNLTQKGKINRYDYFNLPDSEIKKDHSYSGRIPVCNVAGNDYYSLSMQVVYSLSEAEGYVRRELIGGSKDIVFKLVNVNLDSQMINTVVDIAKRQFQGNQGVFSANVSVEVRYNQKQGVIEIGFG